jgi:hypothetical protein
MKISPVFPLLTSKLPAKPPLALFEWLGFHPEVILDLPGLDASS